MMALVSIIVVLALIIEIRFKPRLEVTVNRDVLLFYNVYTFGTRRNYINLHIKW
jgi:hypothetical protein